MTTIPDAWLMGFCRGLERREGVTGMEAIRRAVEHWNEQTRLGEEWDAQRAEEREVNLEQEKSLPWRKP